VKTSTSKKIIVLTPAFGAHGGVSSVAAFLFDSIREYSIHKPELISVSTAARDFASRRAIRPLTWLRGPVVVEGHSGHIRFSHVGSVLAELEPARYWPHRRLNALLKRADLILVVSGTPAWAYLARDCGRPILLQNATFAAREREQKIREQHGLARAWTRAVTRVVSAMEPAALRLATKVFVENRFAEERVASIVGGSRVVRAPIGIDTTAFKPDATYHDDGYLLVVGRINDPRKNAAFLLASYARLRSQLPSCPPLVIAGESPNEALRSRVVAHGLSESVHFVENPTRTRLIELYQHAALALLPSAEEGFGIVAIEAMACGIPVVATRCTGPEEIIVDDETGHLVQLDEQSFANVVDGALRNRSRRRVMAARARAVAIERYSMGAASKPYLAAIDAI